MSYLFKQEKEIPIYRGLFVIILSDDSDAVKKLLPHWDASESLYAHSINCEYKKKDAYVVILNYTNPNRDLSAGDIAHEALHIANFLAHNRGIECSFDNDEPIAYLVSYFVDEIQKFALKTIQ